MSSLPNQCRISLQILIVDTVVHRVSLYKVMVIGNVEMGMEMEMEMGMKVILAMDLLAFEHANMYSPTTP